MTSGSITSTVNIVDEGGYLRLKFGNNVYDEFKQFVINHKLDEYQQKSLIKLILPILSKTSGNLESNFKGVLVSNIRDEFNRIPLNIQLGVPKFRVNNQEINGNKFLDSRYDSSELKFQDHTYEEFIDLIKSLLTTIQDYKLSGGVIKDKELLSMNQVSFIIIPEGCTFIKVRIIYQLYSDSLSVNGRLKTLIVNIVDRTDKIVNVDEDFSIKLMFSCNKIHLLKSSRIKQCFIRSINLRY